jgi:signal transduction histidine kinase
MRERIDERVEVGIVQRAVHPAIALGDISIEIVAAEDYLKCTRSADQTWEPFQSSAARDQTDADLGVAEQGVLPAGEAHVASQHELVTDATRAAANLRDAHDWRGRKAQNKVAPKAQRLWPFSCFGYVEMGDKKLGPDFSKDVSGIVDAGNEGLWLSTGAGVVHVAKDEIDRALQDSSYRFHWEQFDSYDGLPGKILRSDPFPKTIQGTDGRIWFVANRGVAWIDPRKISKNVIPPPVLITSVSADGSSHLDLADLQLPARANNVQIEYTALSLSVPERVQFRYKLEGIDKQWQDPGTRREAYYSRLPPGRYTFHVIASNNDGIWNDTGATLDFTMPPAWFQTTWFYSLCAAAGFLMMWCLYQVRVRYIARAISARFDERLAERTLIARDLHDTLLQTIQGSKLVADSALKPSADPAKIREALEQLSIWLARATTEGRTALNSLRTSTTETNDLAEAFRRATEECRTEKSMETSFSVVGDARVMHPIVRDEVYRVGYEAIRNASVHSQGSKLRVTLTYADELSVDVADNGVGLDPLVADRGKEGHFGLRGMRERAARIAGKLIVTSSPESGTQVKLVVPGKIIYRKTTPDNH